MPAIDARVISPKAARGSFSGDGLQFIASPHY
jgi:hypothetical protein